MREEGTMDKIQKFVEDIFDEMVKNRRDFHKYPESGWFTFATTAKIASKLEKYGYKLEFGESIIDKTSMLGLGSKENMQKAFENAKRLLNDDELKFLPFLEGGLTGVVATIDTGRVGPFTAFRFDIDGVDVTESKQQIHRPFKDGFSSENDGVTHACGHDGHISIGLALAKIISMNLKDLKGKFKFIFQTGEEGCRGAVAMEKAGVVKDIDYLLGAHIGFQCKENRSFICNVNKILATTKFDVYFKGRSSHASGAPENGANALLAAAQAAISMHGITRHSLGVTRVNVGILKAGEGRNVIAPNGFIACETRGETTELNDFMRQKCFDIVDGVSKIYGVDYEIVQTGGTAGGDSSTFIGDKFYAAAKASPYIDNEKIVENYNFGACEDYAHFMYNVQQNGGQSGYAMIGTKLSAGHHNECFDFDEESLKSGLDVFLRITYDLNS